MQGKVKDYFPEKGYGYITGSDGLDYFFHFNEGCDYFKVDDEGKVRFDDGVPSRLPRVNDVVFFQGRRVESGRHAGTYTCVVWCLQEDFKRAVA